jgi:hypothetical protein
LNVIDIVEQHTKLKKVASTKGGEWQGPCPWCGGKNRFHVWPQQNAGQGTYWCRSCGKGGDAIQFLRDFEGKTFKEACDYLNIKMEEKSYKPTDTTPREFQPREPETPEELWQVKAGKFIAWAQEQLKNNQAQLDWLASRGINQAAAEAARLGWNPGENGKDLFRARTSWGLSELKKENGKPRMLWLPIGLVIPCTVNGIIQRVRIRRSEGEPRYYIVPGSSSSTMALETDRKAFVLVESELDAIACASSTTLAGSVATGTLEGKPDAAAYQVLKNATQILNALDYGDEGGGKDAAKRANKWWSEKFGDKCERWPVPIGKDPGEAYAAGTDLETWIKKGLWPVVYFEDKKNMKSHTPMEKNAARANPEPPSVSQEKAFADKMQLAKEIHPLIAETYRLLLNNPSVKIINTPDRYTALRNGKYVGGRINELVFKEQAVMDYILNHPATEIDYKNFIGEIK